MNLLNQSQIFQDKIQIHATIEKREIEDERNHLQVFKKDLKPILKCKNKWFMSFKTINERMCFLTL